jgi:hypothetical protein
VSEKELAAVALRKRKARVRACVTAVLRLPWESRSAGEKSVVALRSVLAGGGCSSVPVQRSHILPKGPTSFA